MDSICERHTGALVKLTPSGDRKTWNVHQESVLPPLPHFEGWKPIDWKPEDGPIQLFGYVHTKSHEAFASVTICGIFIGVIFGSLDENVQLDFDLFIAKGQINLFMKGGNVMAKLKVNATPFKGTDGAFSVLEGV
ncbi:hypothetical protein VFPFJ_04310 [Purpureocillium lilacinum]|nr:hypothetical protein VFPFJ_04310 [Purpureocillium lilacinum]OAQ90151.1 hypothetical protein VFPFJ_04310 [Purpureocillium lilacinum]